MQIRIFFIKTVVIFALSWLAGWLLPWWWAFALAAFIIGMPMQHSAFANFLSGGLGAGLYYLISGYMAGKTDHFVFADKIAAIFGEGAGVSLNGISLLAAGSLLFFIIGGLASMSGALIATQGQMDRLQDRRKSKTKRLKLDL
jgi:hypothetical protein